MDAMRAGLRRRNFGARFGHAAITLATTMAITMATTTRTQAQPNGRSPGAGRTGEDALHPQGRGTLRFLGMAVYEAELFVADGFDAARPLATALSLRLTYRRALQGRLIAERSIAEIRRAGPIADAQSTRWLAFMTTAFPDVKPGDTIRGDWQPARSTSTFQHNDAAPTQLKDSAFGHRFFGIWLHDATSEPALRAALFGVGTP